MDDEKFNVSNNNWTSHQNLSPRNDHPPGRSRSLLTGKQMIGKGLDKHFKISPNSYNIAMRTASALSERA